MGGIQQLGGLQNHFNDMFVAVPPRTLSGFSAQEEDIHLLSVSLKQYLLTLFVSVFSDFQVTVGSRVQRTLSYVPPVRKYPEGQNWEFPKTC